MGQTQEQAPVRIEIERLTRPSYMWEVVRGVGVVLGLALLWFLEVVRNVYFRGLDRLSIKPRRKRRVSAFPPGRPRKRQPV